MPFCLGCSEEHQNFMYFSILVFKTIGKHVFGGRKKYYQKNLSFKIFSSQNQKQKFWKFSFDEKLTYICTLRYHICIQNVFSFHLIYILCMLVKILDLPKLWSIKKLKIFAMRLHDFRNVLSKRNVKDWMVFKVNIGGERFNLSFQTLFWWFEWEIFPEKLSKFCGLFEPPSGF